MSRHLDLLVAFVSLVVIPFLGVLSALKKKVFAPFATILAVWFFLGLLAVAAPMATHPKGAMPPPTPEEIRTYESTPYFKFVVRLWAAGLAIGLPLLGITWLHEHRNLSKWVQRLSDLISILTFLSGAYVFVTRFVIPRW